MATITVGQIGLGEMGGNVASHLIDEGFDVVGFDVDEEALNEFEEYGGRVADSNADLAAESDIVLSALSYPEIIEAAYLGPDGVIEGAHEDLICIEQSTVPPASTKKLAEELEVANVDFLGAPFLGGAANCRDGTVVLPVGGKQAVYEDERVQEVLNTMSRHTHYMGEIGAGKATKLVNNCISLGNTVLALEALSLGVAHDLDVNDMYEALKYGAASSVMFRVVMPSALNRDFEPSFPVKYTQKDLRFALRAAEEVDFPMQIASQNLQLYTAAAAQGWGDEDAPAVVKVFEQYLDGVVAADEPIEPEVDDPILSK